jgi:hypothetical protein
MSFLRNPTHRIFCPTATDRKQKFRYSDQTRWQCNTSSCSQSGMCCFLSGSRQENPKHRIKKSERTIAGILPVARAGCMQTGAVTLHNHTGNCKKTAVSTTGGGKQIVIPMYLNGLARVVNRFIECSITSFVHWPTFTCWYDVPTWTTISTDFFFRQNKIPDQHLRLGFPNIIPHEECCTHHLAQTRPVQIKPKSANAERSKS